MNRVSQNPNFSLTKSKEEPAENEEFINLLPRAVIRPNTFVLLDGTWKFEEDADDVGMTDNWYVNHEYANLAEWPGSVEDHLKKINKEADSWRDEVIVWYEREFPLPLQEKDSATCCSELQLTFGACGYETRVWLNGILLKTIEGEELHIGGYTSFSYILERYLLKPVNRLTVRIANSMDADTTRGKQESQVYKRGGIWYRTYTGGVRSVWLESVERNRLRSRIGVGSIIEDDLVRFDFTTQIRDPGVYKIRLAVFERKQTSTEPIAYDEYEMPLIAGQKKQRLVLKIPNAELWSPASPHLYRLVAQLVNQNGYIAEIDSLFGLRKIESRGSTIYLNNNSIYLDGILYQPGIATYEQIKKHMYAMKALGCNLVRIHIAGVDPRIYNLADKLGLLLWVEVPSPHRSTKISRQNHKAELLRMLALIGTHPSVIIWSLYNEDWGAQDIATNTETRQYIMEMYDFMQLAYPQFLVVDNDGWHHISNSGNLCSDLMSVHLYTPELKRWIELLDGLVEGRKDGVAALPLTVGDPFFYKRQIPLIVSEWGGFGFSDYGGPKDAEERTSKIKLFKEQLKLRLIAGDVYTQATNIEDEQNGLIDFVTGELQVPENLLKCNQTD
jgi:beta-galactosidase/beta-glucuronidase